MASPGSIVQLMARGGDSEVTGEGGASSFFRRPLRHALFATVQHEELFPGAGFRFGQAAQATLLPRGDLLGEIVLELTLPAIPGASGACRWVDPIGYVLLRRARLYLDGVLIEDHERLWMDIADEVYFASRKSYVDAMIRRGESLPMDAPHTVYIPMKFSCCQAHRTKPRMYLPTRSNVIKVELDIEAFDACINEAARDLGLAPPSAPLDARLVCDSVVLDEPDKASLSKDETILVYQGVQDVEATNFRIDSDDAYATTVLRADLREVLHPLTALIWVAYDFDYESYFAYRDIPHTTTMHIGSQKRFVQTSDISRLVQRYFRSPAATDARVHLYPFALNVEDTDPNGSMSLGRDSPMLRFDLPLSNDKIMVKVFATTTKFLKITKGAARPIFQ